MRYSQRHMIFHYFTQACCFNRHCWTCEIEIANYESYESYRRKDASSLTNATSRGKSNLYSTTRLCIDCKNNAYPIFHVLQHTCVWYNEYSGWQTKSNSPSRIFHKLQKSHQREICNIHRIGRTQLHESVVVESISLVRDTANKKQYANQCRLWQKPMV